MLSSDLPIAKLEEDELNRGSFAESLAKTLVQYSFHRLSRLVYMASGEAVRHHC